MKSEPLIICPVHNEEEHIRDFYYRLRKNYKGSALFIDDGSTDRSSIFLGKIKSKNTFIMGHSQRRGYGAALLSGFDFARENNYKRIVTIDVDLQHRPEQIPQFLKELFEWEVVLGSRYIKITNTLNIPKSRLTINHYISELIKVLFSVEFTDPFCGFRGYRDSFLKKAKLTNQSYGIALEILLEVIKQGVAFCEIPVEAIYFKDIGKFLDGLDDPCRRLLYYLEVISKKRKEIISEEKVFVHKPSP